MAHELQWTFLSAFWKNIYKLLGPAQTGERVSQFENQWAIWAFFVQKIGSL